MRIVGLTGAALLIAASGYAQDEIARRQGVEMAVRVPLEQAVKSAPYSAETLVEGSQQLADGNRISRKTTGRVYRDGEGRTRREEDRPNGTTAVSITDPIGGFSYSLDAVNKIAWRTPMGTATAIMGKLESGPAVVRRVEPVRTAAPDGTTTPHNKVTLEEVARAGAVNTEQAAGGGGGGAVATVPAPGGRGGFGGGVALPRTAMPSIRPVAAGPLEHKILEGIAVEGRRMTTTIPAGQVGNEQPITITSEEWRSPDLNLLVLTRHSDPRTGDSSYRLQNVVRAEPDRSLFMVPPDYAVKDTGIRKMLEASQRK